MSQRFIFPFLCAVSLVAGCAGGPPSAPSGSSQSMPDGPKTLPSPETLIGKNAAAIKSLVGSPVLVRRDGPAEIWQYQGPDCTANLFLYKSGKDLPFTLDHIDALDRNGKRMDTATCFGSIEAARRGL